MKFIHKKWAMVGMLAVFSLAPLFAVHQSTSAATLDTGGGSYVPAEYANVKAVGWTFWVDGNQQEINTGNFTQIIANKNQAGQDQYSVFAYSKTKNGNVKEYVQRPDYYGHSGETQTCADHIDYNTTTGDTTLWMHSNNCSQVTGPGITLARDIPADILEKASRENFGQEPLGCPSFDPIPANQTGLSYNCPDNKGSVKNGVYSATETIEPTPTTPDTIEETSPCEGTLKTFGWLICGATELADGFIGGVEKALTGLLTLEPSEYGEGVTTSNGALPANPLKTAWSAVRILSTIVLVGVALFMIIAQILSLDIFSAYTVKKVVPRLVIAAILMQLSWYLFTGLIVVVNTVGIAISDVMMAPFGGKDEVGNITEILSDFYANNLSAGATVNGAINAGVIGGIAYLVHANSAAAGAATGLGGQLGIWLIGAAIGIAIVLFVGVSVLIMRQIGIIALLIVSPLALVAWILPGTQNFWRQWWQLFSKLLLMFPLIFILLTSGKILAWIIANSHWSFFEGIFTFFMILLAYFGPFLLIPTTFAIAGGLFAKMVGKIDGLGKGIAGRDIGGFRGARKKQKEEVNALKREKALKDLSSDKSLNRWQKARAQHRAGILLANRGMTAESRELANKRLERYMESGRAAASKEGRENASNLLRNADFYDIGAGRASTYDPDSGKLEIGKGVEGLVSVLGDKSGKTLQLDIGGKSYTRDDITRDPYLEGALIERLTGFNSDSFRDLVKGGHISSETFKRSVQGNSDVVKTLLSQTPDVIKASDIEGAVAEIDTAKQLKVFKSLDVASLKDAKPGVVTDFAAAIRANPQDASLISVAQSLLDPRTIGMYGDDKRIQIRDAYESIGLISPDRTQSQRSSGPSDRSAQIRRTNGR